MCGDLDCEMEFSLYYYKDDPHVQRAKMYDPPPPVVLLEEPSRVQITKGTVKNVNEKTDELVKSKETI